MNDPMLAKLSTAAIWLEQGERKCIQRLLQREQRWFPPSHMDPQGYIDELLVANDNKVKKGVDRHWHFASSCRHNASALINVENKPRVSVADEAMTVLRDAFLIARDEYNTSFPAVFVAPRVPV